MGLRASALREDVEERGVAPAIRRSRGFALSFGLALSISAALLFALQPMVARMLLPFLGGAPAVWNTCLVVFQALLLAGYLYAHASLAWLGVRRQALVHAGLLLVPLLALPVAIEGTAGRTWAGDSSPVLALVALLLAAIGLPFVVLSASAPVLQRWFSGLPREEAAGDPYFLYSASNLGSMLGLLAYPTVIEPLFGLERQSAVWRAGYLLYVAAAIGCAIVTWRTASDVGVHRATAAPLGRGRRLRWLCLAALPSSLLLGTTTYVTTDVAAVPLLWVPPLALYLGTFIVVFARRPPVSHRLMVRALPFVLTLTVALLLADLFDPPALVAAVHLATLGVVALVCHGELARDRPDPTHLTEFYLWLSVGGVAGGIVNAFVAPVVLDRLLEYPLALVLAPLAVASLPGRRDVAIAAALGALAAGLVVSARVAGLPPGFGFVVGFAVPLVANYVVGTRRPARFALGLGAILIASAFHPGTLGETVYRARNFFGTLRVARDPGGQFVQLVHGRTVHGRQSLEPARRGEPLAYYHPTGPAGEVFTLLGERTAGARVAVIGLGAGALARYARADQTWTFYEINPAVVSLARDPRFFSFLSDSFPDPARYAIVLGDARLRLAEAPPAAYDLLVLDAFSSDAVPLHLLTAEALRLYLEKLAPHGVIAAHVSNRYVRLAPVLAALARDAGLEAAVRDDRNVSARLLAIGKTPSTWVALARPGGMTAALARLNPDWTRLDAPPGTAPWTDDYANLFSALAL
jgi:hypothetical protein